MAQGGYSFELCSEGVETLENALQNHLDMALLWTSKWGSLTSFDIVPKQSGPCGWEVNVNIVLSYFGHMLESEYRENMKQFKETVPQIRGKIMAFPIPNLGVYMSLLPTALATLATPPEASAKTSMIGEHGHLRY